METFKHQRYEVPAPGFPSISGRFKDYAVVLKPAKDEAEWWAGAPSIARDKDGVFWLACRMRTADAPRGLRGYEIRILRSVNGIDFAPAKVIRREDVPVPGFERPALLVDPATGLFKLYGCSPVDEQWSIIKFDDAQSPAEFEPRTGRVVIGGPAPEDDRDNRPREFKDPVIFHDGAKYHCYAIGYLRRNERVYHFISDDGETWRPYANGAEAIINLCGWHDFFVRPASILPAGMGWFFIYEGSNAKWYDPVYNIATGLGFTFDLHTIIDLTPDAPLVISGTPGKFATWRYSHWMRVDDEIRVYAEVACPNETKEIRLYRLALK